MNEKVGKVRDIYFLNDAEIMLVCSDRISAFDRVITNIPHKGRVLNLLSMWWFDQTKHIASNHFKYSLNSNSMVVKRCKVFPIEFIVRRYMTGSTNTSLWTHYSRGERVYCGITFPDGLKQYDKLPNAVITPTTKSDVGHDELIDRESILREKIMTEAELEFCYEKSLKLFAFGQQVAAEHGLILADTKYEFGIDCNGNILLVDEIHTPDSSRYWFAGESMDKDILRNWCRKHGDPYKGIIPNIPPELVNTISEKYVELYELLTENAFIKN
jgi:phosphoribosylaminoimidazole-succinocarboxamide synthase